VTMYPVGATYLAVDCSGELAQQNIHQHITRSRDNVSGWSDISSCGLFW
jgi:hypothetical protein